MTGAGDINGDGRADVIIGSGAASPLGRFHAGSSYVVFGRSVLGTVDLAAFGNDGFRVDGAPPAMDVELDRTGAVGARAGAAASGAGDINGDGLADIAIAAPDASNSSRPLSGSVYIVFGKASSEPVDLASLGSAGYRIDGPTAFGRFGGAVAPAGDVNGDGRPDIVVTSKDAVYVVYGQANTATVDLADLAGKGFRMARTSVANDRSRLTVAGAGDVNGDGRADVIIGSPGAPNPRGPSDRGAAFVVFGQSSSDPIDLDHLGSKGYRIAGSSLENADAEGSLGTAVAGVGDVNGDGRSDVAVGVPYVGALFHRGPPLQLFVEREAPVAVGAVYILFGKPDAGTIDVGKLGSQGIQLKGAASGEEVGAAIAGIGDVNGDGLSDLLVGARGSDRNCVLGSGAAYVLFGRAQPGVVTVDRLGTAGFRLDGEHQFDQAGSVVAGPGDVDGNGVPDLLIGAPGPLPDRPMMTPRSSWTAYVASTAASARHEVQTSQCIRVRLLTRSRTRLLRTGRIRVRVTARGVEASGESIDVHVGLGNGPEAGLEIASGRFRVRDSRAHIITLRLRMRDRTLLLAAAMRRLRIQALREGSDVLDTLVTVPTRR